MTYQADYSGLGKLLRSPEMQLAMRHLAGKVKDRAVSIAPDAAPYGVGYVDAFTVDSGVRADPDRRAFGRVTNHAPYAKFIEYGGKNTPKHRTLGKALDAVNE